MMTDYYEYSHQLDDMEIDMKEQNDTQSAAGGRPATPENDRKGNQMADSPMADVEEYPDLYKEIYGASVTNYNDGDQELLMADAYDYGEFSSVRDEIQSSQAQIQAPLAIDTSSLNYDEPQPTETLAQASGGYEGFWQGMYQAARNGVVSLLSSNQSSVEATLDHRATSSVVDQREDICNQQSMCDIREVNGLIAPPEKRTSQYRKTKQARPSEPADLRRPKSTVAVAQNTFNQAIEIKVEPRVVAIDDVHASESAEVTSKHDVETIEHQHTCVPSKMLCEHAPPIKVEAAAIKTSIENFTNSLKRKRQLSDADGCSPEPRLAEDSFRPYKKPRITSYSHNQATLPTKRIHFFPLLRDPADINFRLRLNEEGRHAWMKPFLSLPPKTTPRALYILWDANTQRTHIDADGKLTLLAGNTSMPLVTREDRQLALRLHCSYEARGSSSPFISASADLGTVLNIWQWRMRAQHLISTPPSSAKPDFQLSIISPDSRVTSGLPLLDFREELSHYGVSHPILEEARGYSYSLDKHLPPTFTGEYLLPYAVLPTDIIGTWSLSSLINWSLNDEARDSCNLTTRPTKIGHLTCKFSKDDISLPKPLNFESWMNDVGARAMKKHDVEREVRVVRERQAREDRALWQFVGKGIFAV